MQYRHRNWTLLDQCAVAPVTPINIMLIISLRENKAVGSVKVSLLQKLIMKEQLELLFQLNLFVIGSRKLQCWRSANVNFGHCFSVRHLGKD